VRSAVLLTFQVKTWNAAKDLQPGRRVATDFDLRFDRAKGVEGLVEQVANDADLGRIPRGAHVVDRQAVVHAHVAFDKASDLPIVAGTIEALQYQDVTAAGGAAIALAAALLIWMRQRRTDGLAQRGGVGRFGSPNTIRQTSFFHAASCSTA
jgi:hypothetical protein